ncbi:hypothetical protein BCR32DRAFT_329888 [Anaeromyces robustus]|uniref:Uncharacterized protein n=1 Tax=Anaeromyces robustus TaxID=1754192 RepID=A0A1Y1WP11_9FUNG|nr:hypothetical protein BCR32DRAFT_329888 [Anaeromyces robustus]|eukprot:ORX75263.1 hypothetical protein BCR32DRAFT_329888 [Anaeromyces robustus]
MNTLYLTAGDVNSVVASMLEAYGMNYEKVTLPANSLVLEQNGVALYNAIVIEQATQEMIANIKPQIEEYQKKYKVRVAYLDTEPEKNVGFIKAQQSVFMRGIVLTPEGEELAKKYQLNGKGMNMDVGTCIVDANLVCQPYNHYEVGINSNNITPILRYNDTDAYAGALLKKEDIESIYVFIPYIESTSAYFTSHLWITWVNYGILDGARRLYFNIQIDDYFADNEFNSTDDSIPENAKVHYRTSVEDMENLVRWQKDIQNNRMPYGSDFKIELAMNGLHILTEAHHKEYVARNWTVFDVPVDYVKPLTEVGSNRWAGNEDTDWDVNALKKDKLFEYFQKPENQDNFNWLTHTFSHQNLNYASIHDAEMEISLNIKMADEPYLGMYKRKCFSPHSIVTPEISGLHNGHALQIFDKYGIKYGVGDTSRTDLNPENYYLPFITTQASSNFEGFLVIPRQPPQVYWDCSTIEENLAIYKDRYGQEIDWKTHLDNEAVLHVKNFLKLRHDPYMFHEGNLRNSDYPEVEINGNKGKYGMMQQWVERIVEEIDKYMDWPLVALKMDDLAETYISRLNQKNCKPQYTMVIDDKTGQINEIKVASTTGQCKVPLLAFRNANFDESSVNEVEKRGDDPATAWVEVNESSPKSIKFKDNVKWSDDTYTPQYTKPGSKKGSSLTWLWILLGVLALLLVGLGLYYFIRNRKQSKYPGSSN